MIVLTGEISNQKSRLALYKGTTQLYAGAYASGEFDGLEPIIGKFLEDARKSTGANQSPSGRAWASRGALKTTRFEG